MPMNLTDPFVERDFALDVLSTPDKTAHKLAGTCLAVRWWPRNLRHPDYSCCIVALSENVPSGFRGLAILLFRPPNPRTEVVESLRSYLDGVAVYWFRKADVGLEIQVVLPALSIAHVHAGSGE